MAKKKELNLNLPGVDDLFTTQEERQEMEMEKVVMVPPDTILDFPNHPFKVRQDEEMQQLLESVKEHGILVPTLVRYNKDGKLEMVAGHRRKFAGVLANLEEIPCIIRELTDDEATVIMVDSNLQREKILPSEKAFAYKMKLDAMSRQGKRTDLTCAPVGHKLKNKSRDILAEDVGESREQIRRYIRLTFLIPSILQMVDEGRIAFRPAVELSYLPEEKQEYLLDMMECEDSTPSLAQAIKMKKFEQEEKLSEDVIYSIMTEEKPNQVEQFKIPKKKLAKYFPSGTPKEKMEDTIIKALELYRKRQRERNNAR
jgi:ParB family chromosome partitioning protein